MSITPSQRGDFVSSPSPRRLPGAITVPGSFFHALASVRQDLPHEHIQPDCHHRFPSVATSKSQTENPRCRSNQPNLENLAKVLMR